MDSPVFFVFTFMGVIMGLLFFINWRHNREQELKKSFSLIPGTIIFSKLKYRIWQFTSISWNETDMFIFENGFILDSCTIGDNNQVGYFFTKKNYALEFPSTTFELVLKRIESKNNKILITAATNELNSTFLTYTFYFKDNFAVAKLIAAFERNNIKTDIST